MAPGRERQNFPRFERQSRVKQSPDSSDSFSWDSASLFNLSEACQYFLLRNFKPWTSIAIGIAKVSHNHCYLHSRRWAHVRRFVLTRDGWRCVICGRAGRLEVDHITPMVREPGQDPYDPNGLQALCRRCHIEKTRAENRRPLTPQELAWRELVDELIRIS